MEVRSSETLNHEYPTCRRGLVLRLATPLFTGDSDLALLRAVQESLIAPPSRLNPDVPEELSEVVMKALARPPEERFQTAFEMEKALANYVLRNAKSVDDSSVGLFLQQVFREDFEAGPESDRVPDETLPPRGGDDFGLGDTSLKAKPQTITATPVPTTPGRRRGVMDDDDVAKARTEEFTPAPRPRTEQMPAMKRSSRKLEPLPVSEPSVVVRPSIGVLPDLSVSATEPATAGQLESVEPAPRSNVALVAMLSVLVVGLVLGVGYVSTRPEPVATAPEVEAPPAVVPEAVKDPVVALPPPPVEVLDAGAAVVAVAEPESVKPASIKAPGGTDVVKVIAAPAPVARKMGTISVQAVPFATVVIQGKSYEVTGVQKLPAPAGTYEITLIHPKRKVKTKVTVQANQTTSVTFSAGD